MSQKLGQHFLKNKSAINTILNALAPEAGETVIEIGPGHGVLTAPLAELCAEKKCRVVAVEKDGALAQEVRSKIKEVGLENIVDVIEGNVLDALTSYILPLTSYTLVGNLPYYLTGALLRLISELEPKPKRCVFMLQREVAERIAARPPKMNLLAAATQVWAEPKILQLLKPSDFSPPPKVQSAVIELKTRANGKWPGLDEPRRGGQMANGKQEKENYYRFIKILFKQPRKTILNNLADGYDLTKEKVIEVLTKHNLAATLRPQNLDLETIISLSNASIFYTLYPKPLPDRQAG